MKRGLSAAILVAFALTAVAHTANAQRRVVPFAGAGLAKGMGDLSDDTGNGWLAFAGVDIPLGTNPALSLGVTGSYARVPYTGTFDEATKIAGVFGELGYTFLASSTSKLKPYVRAGAGATLRTYDPGSTGFRETSEGKLAFSGGAGLRYLLAPVSVFAGGHIVTDGDAGYLAIHGGLAWRGSARR